MTTNNEGLKLIPCKEQGCGEKIPYVPHQVLGLMSLNHPVKSEGKAIYLTCTKGHTNRYIVS